MAKVINWTNIKQKSYSNSNHWGKKIVKYVSLSQGQSSEGKTAFSFTVFSFNYCILWLTYMVFIFYFYWFLFLFIYFLYCCTGGIRKFPGPGISVHCRCSNTGMLNALCLGQGSNRHCYRVNALSLTHRTMAGTPVYDFYWCARNYKLSEFYYPKSLRKRRISNQKLFKLEFPLWHSGKKSD